MNPFHSVGAEAPPNYEMLENRPAISVYDHSDCMKPSNESYMSPEQRSRNMALRDWIRNRKRTVAAASCLWSCSELSRVSLLSRVSRSTTRAYCSTWLARLRRGHRSGEHLYAFTASLGPRLVMSGRPLEFGEREISVGPEYDWTAEWGWVLRLRAYTHPEHARCSHWSVDVVIFFQDLPRLMSTGGPLWDRAHVDQSDFRHCINIAPDRARPWVQSSTYTTEIPGIRWRAEAVHRSQHQPLRGYSFTSLLCSERVYQAEIDQRTAAGRAKRVMAYYSQVGYGNDITGQPLDVWHDGLIERFGQFIRPLMPFDSYCEEEERED